MTNGDNTNNNNKDYAVSLDLGTGSVGWAAFYANYRLVRAKGKELIGVRLFDSANTAEERRMHRTTRRRLSRRRWRLHMLDDIFAPEISKIDPNFLARRKYSWVHPDDEENSSHWYGGIIFKTKQEDIEFYKKYPTMYHLRKALMEDDGKHDIREVYLALHHILKARGNFLTTGEIHTDELFDARKFCELAQKIVNYSVDSESGLQANCDVDEVGRGITAVNLSATKRSENAIKAFAYPNTAGSKDEVKTANNSIKAIMKAVTGVKYDASTIFGIQNLSKEEKDSLKVSFSDDDFETKLETMSSILSEEEVEYIQQLQQQYSAISLMRLLGDSSSISEAMCKKYEAHHDEWQFVKEYLRNDENVEGVNTHYLTITHQNTQTMKAAEKEKAIEQAYSYFKDLLQKFDPMHTGVASERIEKCENMRQYLLTCIDAKTLFEIQRTSDNGVIPYQLHLNEMRKILDKQSKYYPFLGETFQKEGHQVRKIEELLRFRIPYYVGPLVSPDSMQASDDSTNHWMVRKDGRNEPITPWNIDEVVNKDRSAEIFIERLVGTDTYLVGEPTVPKNSLLYQEFEVLNELNNVRVQDENSRAIRKSSLRRLQQDEKDEILTQLFERKKEVKRVDVEELLKRMHGYEVRLSGLSDPSKFNSSLSSFVSFAKSQLFGREFVKKHTDLVEKIIELQTVFEDSKTLQHQLDMLDGLTDKQRKELAKGHYTGWGNLSRKFLQTQEVNVKIGADTMRTAHSVMSVLRNSDKNLMEILSDHDNGFRQWIDKQNACKDDSQTLEEQIEELHVSPKAKRGIVQAIRVVDDITKAVGYAPARIFIEMADDFQPSVQTKSRKSILDSLYSSPSLKSDFDTFTTVSKNLKEEKKDALSSNRLYLYYLQMGKDMYTGEPLDIALISSDYDLDHIIPQAMTKDDSLDNLVLVKRKDNARKSDAPTLSEDVIRHMQPFWKQLLDNKLISLRKYNALTRRSYSDFDKGRFVARSLVETRQVMKNVSTILRQRYGSSKAVIGLNSKTTSDMRRYLGFPIKNRDINDYHHAQDALCIGIVGQFAINRGFFSRGEVSDGAFNSFNIYLNQYLKQQRQEMTKDNKRINPFGFIVGSMKSSNEDLKVNPDTGEVVWSEEDAEYLRKVMNYAKILMTYKTGKEYQALYNETRYAPKASLVPYRKEQKNVDLYGGFSGRNVAYPALVELKNGKVLIVDVPTMDAKRFEAAATDDERLEILSENAPKVKNGKYLMSVPKGQLIRYQGELFTIKSGKELNNAQQLWLPQAQYNDLAEFLNGAHKELSVLMDIFDTLMERIRRYYPIYLEKIPDVNQTRSAFMSLFNSKLQGENGDGTQRTMIAEMLKGLHVGALRSDELKPILIKTEWGRVKRALTLSDEDELIFQSPTGLFSYRMTIKQLKDKA